MKILVFLKEVQDTRVPLVYDDPSGQLKTEWNVPVLNPADVASIDAALELKARHSGTHITLIQLGPQSGERFMREALALGCDEAVRIWDEGLDEACVQAKALVFARVAGILGYDLLLTGARSQDSGSAQLGILLAAQLQVRCVRGTISLEAAGKSVVATRLLARGYQERVESEMPVVLAMEPGESSKRYASLPAILEAGGKNIPVFNLGTIGLPRQALQKAASSLTYSPLRFPVSKLRPAPPPDSSLPAFNRIQKLLEGVIAKREGKVVTGEEDHVVEEIFRTLLQEGWLSHLR